MILDQCPHCGVRHVQTLQRFAEPLNARDGAVLWFIERCQNQTCNRLVLVQATNQGQIQQVFPFVAYELDAKASVPTPIVDDFREAGLSLGAGCFKASLVMSRRVLQRCLTDQGCTQNKLVDAIDFALKSNILRKAFHPLADEIRQYGNLGAHPDDDQLANANHESAQHVLEFARLLIHEFYEVPASAALLKKNRQGPKAP
jgi:uncharacterized protein DUF4145